MSPSSVKRDENGKNTQGFAERNKCVSNSNVASADSNSNSSHSSKADQFVPNLPQNNGVPPQAGIPAQSHSNFSPYPSWGKGKGQPTYYQGNYTQPWYEYQNYNAKGKGKGKGSYFNQQGYQNTYGRGNGTYYGTSGKGKGYDKPKSVGKEGTPDPSSSPLQPQNQTATSSTSN